MSISIGVDIGQRRDPTAIAVVESEDRFVVPGAAWGPQETHFVARYLQRLPLGTPYPDVARRLAAVVLGVMARSPRAPTVYVDATGVGTPVIDLLVEAGVSGQLFPVYFTHGDKRTVERGGVRPEIRLGKAWLVSRLQALLQTGRLHLPRTQEAEALGQELLVYEIRVTENANDVYGAFKVGAHDDLVTALGLAVQDDQQSGTWSHEPKHHKILPDVF